MRKKLAISIVFFILISCFILGLPVSVQSQYSGTACSKSIDPASALVNSSTTFNLNISNLGENTIQWLRVTHGAESTVLSFTGGSSSGWSATADSFSQLSFTGGSINRSEGGVFTVNINTGATGWPYVEVSASSNSDGSSAVDCTNGTQFEIYSDSTAPTVSDVTASGTTSSSAVITWTTDEDSTSVVQYGTTDSYGSTESDSTQTTSHSITLTGLSGSTTYNFKVQSADAVGNTGESSNSTFGTGAGPTATPQVVTGTPTPTPKPGPTPAPDASRPVITIKTDFSKPLKIAPEIEGEASDNKGVAKIEYSLDGGDNWIAVDVVSTKNSLRKSFSFTPPQDLDDGNYPIVVRATDTSGNRGLSRRAVMIIDRLKPQIGPQLYHIGPMLLEPQNNGEFLLPADTITSLIFSAVGGPTSIELKIGDETIAAKKNKYTGLWETQFSLAQTGRYELSVTATDGAENVITQSLGFVTTQSKGTVLSDSGTTPTIAVFAKQPLVNEFVLWDGAPYGINNPINTEKDGRYSIILPPGTYYIQYSGAGFIKTNSTIFTLSQPTIISKDVTLQTAKGLRLGPFTLNFWDLWKINTVSLTPDVEKTLRHSKSELQNKPFPSFSLNSDKERITELSLRGEASVLTILSSWSPFSQNQLLQLEKISPELANIVVLYPQESELSVMLNKKRGGYKSTLASDKDGELSEKLDVQTVPTHYFIDRQGIVKDVVVGVLTAEEIMSNLKF